MDNLSIFRVIISQILPERGTKMDIKNLRDWSAFIRQRDARCTQCGRTEDLHAHHIKPKSTHPELKLDPNNGTTLCYRCHKQEHERARPPRIRSSNQSKKTLLKQIDAMKKQLIQADIIIGKKTTIIDELEQDIKLLVRSMYRE